MFASNLILFGPFKVAGNERGGRYPLRPQVEKLLDHCIEAGDLKDGDEVFIKLASDGTNITRKEIATASTISISNKEKTLVVGTVMLAMTAESYEVDLNCVSTCFS